MRLVADAVQAVDQPQAWLAHNEGGRGVTERFPDRRAWYETPRFRAAALAIVGVVLLVEGIICVFARQSDYVVCLTAGRHFLAGDPHGNHQYHYMLGRLMLNALPALLPYHLGRATVYLLAAVCTALSLGVWIRMLARRWEIGYAKAYAAAAFSVALLYPYLIRDLDDAGPHLLLWTFFTLAAWRADRSEDVRSGFWLAMAASFKTTGLLYLPFVLYKRRWKLAGAACLFLIVVNLLTPAMYLGWDVAAKANRKFFEKAIRSVANDDPSKNVVEPARHQNQNLATAMARLLQTYPPEHELYLPHPLFFQFGTLDPHAAGVVFKITLAVAGAAIAFRMRKRWSQTNPDDNLPAEWAAVGVLAAILSPLCWLQHLVVMLPCVLCEFCRWLSWPRECGAYSRWRIAALSLIGFIVLVLQRDVVQHDLSIVLLSYKINTIAAVLSIVLVLTLPKKPIPQTLLKFAPYQAPAPQTPTERRAA